MLSVLPPKSINLLPPQIQELMTINSPIYDFYPDIVEIDKSGTNTDWQGIVLVPPPEISRIIKAVNETDKNITKQFIPSTSLIMTRSETDKSNIQLAIEKENSSIVKNKSDQIFVTKINPPPLPVVVPVVVQDVVQILDVVQVVV